MKKTGKKWLIIVVVMISTVWIFIDVVSVKETKSFSSRDGDILNSPAADKFFNFFAIFSNQSRSKQVFYEKMDNLKNVNNESDVSAEAAEDKTSEDKQSHDQ